MGLLLRHCGTPSDRLLCDQLPSGVVASSVTRPIQLWVKRRLAHGLLRTFNPCPQYLTFRPCRGSTAAMLLRHRFGHWSAPGGRTTTVFAEPSLTKLVVGSGFITAIDPFPAVAQERFRPTRNILDRVLRRFLSPRLCMRGRAPGSRVPHCRARRRPARGASEPKDCRWFQGTTSHPAEDELRPRSRPLGLHSLRGQREASP